MTNDGEERVIEDDPTVQVGISHKDLSPAIVYLLDGKKNTFYIHKNSEGEVLLNMVGKYLQLQERDYFGLTYYDEHGNKNWVYNDRRIIKKLKNMPWEFYFEVKFYPQEPSQLADDFTRYLLCLQIRQDIYIKRLPVTFATQALLASYVVQELRGDYNEHPPLLDYSTFLAEAKTCDFITSEFVDKVRELHKQHKGLTPGEAESAYLEVAKKLNMYGIFTFPAKDNNDAVVIGISAPGISVFNDQVRVHRFLWNHIVKFAYRKNVFSVKLKPDKAINGKKTFFYKMENNGSAKRTWRCGVEHHTFFRLIQPEDDLKSGVICAPRGNRIFHYHGRTQYQTKLHATMFDHVSTDIDRSDNIRVGKTEVCYIRPVEIIDEKNKDESKIEHPVSEINVCNENFLTPVKESSNNKDQLQYTKDTLNSSGYGSAPSSSRVRFADRLPLKLEGKKVRRNLFGKSKEDDNSKEGLSSIGGTYPKDQEETKTDIVLTNKEMNEVPIDYMVSVYHSGQSVNNRKKKYTCCGSINSNNNKKNIIKKDDISEPIRLTEDVEKYPLRYKVDVYHSGRRNTQKYGINKNKKNFKRLTHEGPTEIVKRDKVDLTFYPHDTSEHPVKERLEKNYELECEPLRKYASKYHSGLSVMSKKEAKEQKKIAKRDRLLIHESTPSRTTKSSCAKCNCIGNQLPSGSKKKTKFDDDDFYGLSKEPYEGPLSMECKKEEFKGEPLKNVCDSYEIPKYKPANKKRSNVLTCVKPQKRMKKDDEYIKKDSLPETEEKHHIVKKMLKEKDYPVEVTKKKIEYIEKIEERPIIEYDVAKTVIDTEKDWSLKVGDGKETGIKKTTRTLKTLLPQHTSIPHSSKDNIYDLCFDTYDGPLEVVEKKGEIDTTPLDSHVQVYKIPTYTTKKTRKKVNEISTTSENLDQEHQHDIPSSSNVKETKTISNIYNLNTEPYEGKVEIINKSSDLEITPINEHVPNYDILINLPQDEKKFDDQGIQPATQKIIKETILLTQKSDTEKPITVSTKEVAFATDNIDISNKKEKTNSLTRFIGRFNKKDNEIGKKKQGTILSDHDSGVDDILSGTEAGTLSRKDNQKEIKKEQKKKKNNLLCSSTGKKGSMAYLPIQHTHHAPIDKGYPMKEEPYTGELESFNKINELPSESLRNSVQVYHSGLSDTKPSWNSRFVIFSRTKHEGVEEIIDKNEINKDPYQLLNTQPYDGPLEKITHDQEISTEPIKHYSKVYHHGQSISIGTKKKGKSKKNNKKHDSILIDSEEEDYQLKDKTSSLSRFMGFFNRRGGKSSNDDAINAGITTENDSGMDASNSSAEVPTKYSLESYDKKNKNKTSKYILNTEPFLGTYNNTIKVNELQMEPLKDSVKVYHSGQSVSTIKNRRYILNDQTTESDTEDEKRNGRSNTLTRIIGKFHMPKKHNGLNTLDGGYPKISQKYEGEYETINRIDEVKKIPLTQEVQLYNIPKYQAKIEKKIDEPSCSYCAPVGRKQSLNVYDKNEELTNEEDNNLNLHKDQKSSIGVSEDQIESKEFAEDEITATVMIPEHMVNDDFKVSVPENVLEEFENDKNIKAHILINKDNNLEVKNKKTNVSCFGKTKDKPINLDIYPQKEKYDGPVYDVKTSESLPKTKLEDFVDLYPIPKYKNKSSTGKKCGAFNCVKGNNTNKKIEESDNNLYLSKTSYEKPEIESQIKVKTGVDIESRKPELEAFYEMPTKEKEIDITTPNIEVPKTEIKVKKQKVKELKCTTLNCAKKSPEHKIESTYETSQKEFNISNEHYTNNEHEDMYMKILVPETLEPGNVKISVPDSSFNNIEGDIKAHIVIDEPEIEKPTTTFKSKKNGLACVSCFSNENDADKNSINIQHEIKTSKDEIQLETTTTEFEVETEKLKLKKFNCAQLNCAKEKPEVEIGTSNKNYSKKINYNLDTEEIETNKSIELEVEIPSANINIDNPEGKIELPEINLKQNEFNNDKKLDKINFLDCAQLKCIKKLPEANYDASYEHSPKKINVQLEPLETEIHNNIKLETNIPTEHINIESPKVKLETSNIEIVKPKIDTSIKKTKSSKCAQLKCLKTSPEAKYDASYELSPKKTNIPIESYDIDHEEDIEMKVLIPEHLAEGDIRISIPENSMQLPEEELKAHIKIEETKLPLLKEKFKPKKTKFPNLSCIKNKKRKYPTNLEAYPKQVAYEGTINELKSEPLLSTCKLDQHVNLYPIPKYKIINQKTKRCNFINCARNMKKTDHEIAYTKSNITNAKSDIAINVDKPDINVDVPEITAEADLKKPEIDVKKPKIKGPRCAPLQCFGKKPKHELEASYDIPSKDLKVEVEKPEMELDIEKPAVNVDVPEITAEAKLKKPEIDVKKPKIKGPRCAPLQCFGKKPKHELEASYDIPSKDLKIEVERPDMELDIEKPEIDVDVPEIIAEAKLKKPEINVKKPKIKGPRCAPLQCFGKKPKHEIEASYDIPSKDLKIEVEKPEIEVDIEKPAVNVDVPEITAEAKLKKPEIDVKKPKIKGPRCAPLQCFGKKPKHELEASYDIPSKDLKIEVERPDMELDIEKPEIDVDVPEIIAEAKLKKPEINVKKPKIKGPRCAPLQCFGKKPKHELEASYDIPSKDLKMEVEKPEIEVDIEKPEMELDIEKPSIKVDVPEITAEAKLKKPEIELKKPKIKGPRCAPLQCFGKKPKHELKASYDIPSKDLKIEVERPDMELDIEKTAVNVDVPEITAEAKLKKAEIDVKKPKIKGPRCAPLQCFGKKPKHELEASYDIPSKDLKIEVEKPEIEVDIEKPEMELDIEKPSIKVDVPEITAEAKLKKPEIDVKKPKIKGPRCAPLQCFGKKPKHKLEASYDIPSKDLKIEVEKPEIEVDIEKPAVNVDVSEITAEAKLKKPEINVKKPKIKGPRCAPLQCFGKKPKHELDASYDIPSKDLKIEVEKPDIGVDIEKPEMELDIEKPSIKVDVPEITAEAKMKKPEIELKKPKIKGPRCAPLQCFGKKPKHELEASYDIPSKDLKIEVERPDMELDIEKPEIDVDVPEIIAEAKLKKPEINVKKPKIKGPRCAPLQCFGKKPKHELDASYDIPSKDLKIEVERPEMELDIEKPAVNVDVPEITAEAKLKKPEIDVKKPKIKGSRCAPLQCFGKKPKHEFEASYDIPSKELKIEVERPEMELDIEKPAINVDVPEITAEAKLKKPEIDVKKPKIKGPRCAPLQCFGKKPKHELEASYDIPSKDLKIEVERPEMELDIEKPAVNVDVPEITAEAKLKKPEIDVKKPKIKGPRCAPLQCFGKKPKHELDASYDIPSKDLKIEVEKPEMELDIEKPEMELDIEKPAVNVDVPEITAEAKLKKPEIDVKKPKIKGPRCAPLQCFGKKPKHELDASYDIPSKDLKIEVEKPEIGVDIEKPEMELDIEKPSIKVDVPEITAEAKLKKPEIEVKKPKIKGPRCAPLQCFGKKPKHELEASYDIPSKDLKIEVETPDMELDIEKPAVNVDVPEITAEAKLKKPEIDVKKPKIKGPRCAPLQCFGKKPKHELEASYDIPSKDLKIEVEKPEIGVDIEKPEMELDIEKPSIKVDVPEITAEAKLKKPEIDVKKPKIKGPRCAPLQCFGKKPKHELEASYDIPSKDLKIEVEKPEMELDIEKPAVNVDVPEITAEAKLKKPEIDVKKPKIKGPRCAPLQCFGKKPKHELDASYDIPSKDLKIEVEKPEMELDIEKPEIDVDIEKPSIKVDVPEITAEAKLKKPEIDVKKPKIKGPRCAPLQCFGKKPKHKLEASYDIPSKDLKMEVEKPEIEVDIEKPAVNVDVPELTAEAKLKKPEIDVKKPKIKGPRCAPLQCFGKKPKCELEESYDIITKQIKSGCLTNEIEEGNIQVNVLIPEHLQGENLKLNVPENALELDEGNVKGYLCIEDKNYSQPIDKKTLKKSFKFNKSLYCFNNKKEDNEINVKDLKKVYESHYPSMLTSNENELKNTYKNKELETQIIGDYVQVYQPPKYKPLNKKNTISCGLGSCMSRGKTPVVNEKFDNIEDGEIKREVSPSWKTISENLVKQTGEAYYPNEKLDINNYPISEEWKGDIDTTVHAPELKTEPIKSHCNLYNVPKYNSLSSVQVNIPKHKQHFGFEYKAEGPDIVVESRDESDDRLVTPFSTPINTPVDFEMNVNEPVIEVEQKLGKETEFDYTLPQINVNKIETSSKIQVPSLQVDEYNESVSENNDHEKHRMSVESLKFVHDLEEKLNLHVSINENIEKPILEQINDGQVDIVLPPPPTSINEPEEEPLITKLKSLPHMSSTDKNIKHKNDKEKIYLEDMHIKNKKVKQKKNKKHLTDGGDSGISTDDDNDGLSSKKNIYNNFSCIPFMCNGNKNKRLESPYVKTTSGKPQPFGISTKKFSGDYTLIQPINELEKNLLSEHVSKYHSGDSYVKQKTHFHLLPSCIKKQDSLKRKNKSNNDKTLLDEKSNNELDVLEYQRVTDTSKTLTSMFTTTDPLTGDLNCYLSISLHQKMDCECKAFFCRTDNEEVGACCKSCAYSKCYQTLSATINMNNLVKDVPDITISQPTKPSLLSILKKPFKGNSKNEKDENYKKISKKNKTSHYSSDSSSNSTDIKEKEEEKESDIIDAIVPTNDQSKLNSQNSAANMVLNNSNNVSLNKPPMNSNSTGIPQNNMRSSVLNGTVSLEQSSGPYREAEPSDGEVIREERIEHVYKLRGTGNAPTIDPSDMSLSATLAKCVEENSSLPRVTMVCKDVHVKDYGILEPYITEESNLPHTTIQSWQETDVGPDTIFTETDPSGKITKKTIKTQQTKHTIQKQSYQTFNVDDNTIMPQNNTIDKTIKITTPRISSGTKGPVLETRTRTVAYECHPEEALITKDGDIPGEFVSSKTVSTGNKTIETITYKTEKDGIVETRVEHKVTIHSDDKVDHDAELSQALLDVTSMDPDMTVEKIEVKQETQN
ncbi:FERM domain and Band 4.1, C-terminal domain and Pleckstrin homology-like domain and FERM/acyl-CoA-binding protein, 3-helical bundle domain and FERM, N-terminal domain and FERM, C-terminal PH-like domain and FERM central domain and Band 4.1 domain and Band 4.1 family-containing protein [Strongyloides ratti]|uniref:FERM domain-containing protein n=1 Tax=Strongyloides ratti TaxID=34506 RepID=A0A090LAU8_STRRB|nr:FERM domain and Band 4.1, C-terminal domain and Pleckstrin homology-like domain and FERM/acyl-CoA-binding protein, 3-helical bundle domain and FERM, N-terminal domain and FERM, C-terminal PH-like domain and FERM central domain and Band 4.1 domain and Band 4.1 family-containing protein [Strongyloides ratti]CEF64650.1 FERM domain and Band 4.1, C-terminal domain and Pleckstrin homology-like domain and FERM/acyl-CoA-binding protein, 3-helical bundle domain and FERM, N-terminal domain and FERM, C-te